MAEAIGRGVGENRAPAWRSGRMRVLFAWLGAAMADAGENDARKRGDSAGQDSPMPLPDDLMCQMIEARL